MLWSFDTTDLALWCFCLVFQCSCSLVLLCNFNNYCFSVFSKDSTPIHFHSYLFFQGVVCFLGRKEGHISFKGWCIRKMSLLQQMSCILGNFNMLCRSVMHLQLSPYALTVIGNTSNCSLRYLIWHKANQSALKEKSSKYKPESVLIGNHGNENSVLALPKRPNLPVGSVA